MKFLDHKVRTSLMDGP